MFSPFRRTEQEMMVKKYYTLKVSRKAAHLITVFVLVGLCSLVILLPAHDQLNQTGPIAKDARSGTDGTSHPDDGVDDEPVVVVDQDPAETQRRREAEKKKAAAKAREKSAVSEESRDKGRPEQSISRNVAPSNAIRYKLPNGMKGCTKPSPYGRGYIVNRDENGELDSACKMDQLQVTRNVRNTTINSLCAVEELNNLGDLNPDQRKTVNQQILVDDKRKFIYCFVPKVACSNWKRVIKYMNGKVSDLETPMKMDHHKDLVFLGDFSDAQAQYRLNHYFKFMFVRDPMERLLSAYRNKFGQNIGAYNEKYAPKIIEKYRKAGSKVEGSDQSKITFEEFLRFLVDTDTRKMDPHWRPMHELCQPCAIKYDFIGSFEQLSEDASFILDRIRGDSDAYFPKRQSYYKPTTVDKITEELKHVDTQYLRAAVDKYVRDFMLFGYQPPLSDVSRPKT